MGTQKNKEKRASEASMVDTSGDASKTTGPTIKTRASAARDAESAVVSSSVSQSGSATKRKLDTDEHSASDTQAKKKKACSSNLATTLQSPNFWYDDGNVIIQIEDTQFKLYKGHLTRHSPYFKQLLAGPEPTLHVDGVPIYIIDEKTRGAEYAHVKLCAGDLETMLKFAEDMSELVTEEDWPNHEIVEHVLKASTALSFPKLRDLFIYVVEQKWPVNLESYSPEENLYAAETIILGRELKVPGVLKRAFYELLLYDDMAQTDEGRGLLGQGDLLRLIAARDSLSNKWIDITAVSSLPDCFGQTPAKKYCTTQSGIKARKAAWNELVHESGIFKEYRYDVIDGFTALKNAKWTGEGFCGGCIQRMKQKWEEERIALWAELDTLLELEAVE